MSHAIKFAKALAMPFLVIWALALLTHWLWIERQAMLQPDGTEAWDRGVGVGVPEYIPMHRWVAAYGGGQGIDTVIAREDYSLRISTGADGGWYGARTTIPTVVGDRAITFSVRAANWEDIDRLVVQLGTDSSFSDYFGFNLKNYFANPQSGEWLDLVISPADIAVIEGQPRWSAVNDISIRVIPRPGVATKVWFDEWALIDSVAPKARVSFTFDDGFAGVVDAADVLDTHGYAGTLFVIPDLLDTKGYLTQVEVDTLHEQGWEIAGHDSEDLTAMSIPEVDTRLAAVHGYLAEREYVGREHFAYPKGGYSALGKSQVLEYFASARTIDGFIQPAEYILPGNVNAITVSSSTPVAVVMDAVERTKAVNGWLVLVWHDFTSEPTADFEYSLAQFTDIVGRLAAQEIDVAPYGATFSELQNLTPPVE